MERKLATIRDWQEVPTSRSSFQGKLQNGTRLFVTVFTDPSGKVTSMPCIVYTNLNQASLEGDDPRLIKIAKDLNATTKHLLPEVEEFLRDVGVDTVSRRRDDRISEVMGGGVSGFKSIMKGLLGLAKKTGPGKT